MKFNYENLQISQLSLELINQVYIISEKFPSKENYILNAQIKRSTTSVLLNIAEGSGKYSKLDFARYIRNSIGSLLETDANLKIAFKLKYIIEKDLKPIRLLIEELYFKLIAFEKSLIGKRR